LKGGGLPNTNSAKIGLKVTLKRRKANERGVEAGDRIQKRTGMDNYLPGPLLQGRTAIHRLDKAGLPALSQVRHAMLPFAPRGYRKTI